jgi:hypothetical protein
VSGTLDVLQVIVIKRIEPKHLRWPLVWLLRSPGSRSGRPPTTSPRLDGFIIVASRPALAQPHGPHK